MAQGRPRDPDTPHKMRIHAVGNYMYAATPVYVEDPVTGKSRRTFKHWGKMTADMKFVPSNEFMLLSPQERAEMIFPADWDLSLVSSLPSERKAGRPAYAAADSDKLYGAVWLLEHVAQKVHLTADLEQVFDGNREMALDVLTVAMFSVISSRPFSHLSRWQQIERYPAVHQLTPAVLNRLCSRITEQNRMDLFRLRRQRLGNHNLCAVDSTTRTACGDSLADAKIGKRKDGHYHRQTTEVVVYSLETHEPVYNRTFQGNTPDSRSLRVVLAELQHAGFNDLVLVSDRGYQCDQNLTMCIRKHQALVSAASVRQKVILDNIDSLSWINGVPGNLEWIGDHHVLGVQYDLERKVPGRKGVMKTSDRLRLNLYYNPETAWNKQQKLQEKVSKERKELEKLQHAQTPLTAAALKKFKYFTVTRHAETDVIEQYTRNDEAIRKASKTFGFFAIVTLGVDYSAAETLSVYRLRDEQEKYFTSMKSRLKADRQHCWSEAAKTGRRLIEFAGLILISYVRYIWTQSGVLRKAFPCISAMLEEMQPIHCLEHTGRTRVITPFIGKQLIISREFGFEVPKDCSPAYMRTKSRKRQKI